MSKEEQAKDISAEVEQEKDELYEKAKLLGLPGFSSFCKQLARLELDRVKYSMTQMKKTRKAYEMILNKLRFAKTDSQTEKVMDHFPEFMLAYYEYVEKQAKEKEKNEAEKEAKNA